MTKILACTAGPETATKFVKELVRIADSFDAEIIVLNVLPHQSQLPAEELKSRGEEATKIIVDALREKDFEADYKLRFSEDISEGIVKTSEEIGADLIVMGVGEKPSWLSFARKDITEQVIHNAGCPVLALPKVLKRSPF